VYAQSILRGCGFALFVQSPDFVQCLDVVIENAHLRGASAIWHVLLMSQQRQLPSPPSSSCSPAWAECDMGCAVDVATMATSIIVIVKFHRSDHHAFA
jgi:hypothetical protein